MEFGVLGPVEVRADGEPVVVGGARSRRRNWRSRAGSGTGRWRSPRSATRAVQYRYLSGLALLDLDRLAEADGTLLEGLTTSEAIGDTAAAVACQREW